MKLRLAIFLVFVGPVPSYAGNAPSYTAATTPYTGSELWYCDQGATDRSCTVGNIMSNAQLDRVSGLTSATIPQLLYRNASGSYVGSFLGTSQDQYNNYAGQLEISNGTSGAPDTTIGPMFKISRTGSTASSNCANAADTECVATAAFYSVQLSTSTVQATAVAGFANNASTSVGGADSVGGYFSGRVTGSGVGLGTGAYMEGRRDTTTGASIGAEIRNMNITTANCSYNTTGIGGCDGVWVTTSGDGVHTTVFSAALHVGTADPLTTWATGLDCRHHQCDR